MWPFSTLLPHTCSTACVDTTRMDVPCGCIVALASPRPVADTWCITATGLCSGEYANQRARPGSDSPSRPPRQSPRKRTVNTEGCRKSCTYIFVHSTHLHSSSPFYEPRIRFRIASLTLLTCTNAREKDASTLAWPERPSNHRSRRSVRTSNRGFWVVIVKIARKISSERNLLLHYYAKLCSSDFNFPMYYPSHYYFTCNYWNEIFLKRILSSWPPYVHRQTEILSSSECCLCMHLERHLQRSIPDSRECTLQVNVAFRGDYITNRSNI